MGIDAGITQRARRMACACGVHDPFAKASGLLHQLCGWTISADCLRRLVHTQARESEGASTTSQPVAFDPTIQTELHIDAGKVNTPDGWRDVKVAVLAQREVQTTSEPAPTNTTEPDSRLTEVSSRVVVAAVEQAEQFGTRLAEVAAVLGITAMSTLSVLGDGAEWIWNQAQEHFGGAEGVLDFWHGCEKLAEAGKAALGSGTDEFSVWYESAREMLLVRGYEGVCEALAKVGGSECGRVLNYFAMHKERLGYAGRLKRGQVIGSGLVEGTIKQMLNIRMKRTGARWLAKHVGPFVQFAAQITYTLAA